MGSENNSVGHKGLRHREHGRHLEADLGRPHGPQPQDALQGKRVKVSGNAKKRGLGVSHSKGRAFNASGKPIDKGRAGFLGQRGKRVQECFSAHSFLALARARCFSK